MRPAPPHFTQRPTRTLDCARDAAFGVARALAYVSVLGVVALAAPTARAADGALEINQTCAVQTGCFAGDSAGFPVTIASAGSYRLTGNLTVSDVATTAIQVNVSKVSIDLGGFAISGPVSCTGEGSALVCLPAAGSGIGILGSTATESVSVENGVVSGMGSTGVILNGRQARVHALRVIFNGSNGIITTGTGAIVSDSSALANGGSGMNFIGLAGLVSGSSAVANRGSGIIAATNAAMVGNQSTNNGSSGFACGNGCSISDCSARDNGTDGISFGSGAVVSGSASLANGSDGIHVGLGSLVQGNAVRSNVGFGISLSSDSGYRENVVSGNTLGTVTGGANLGNNLCNGLTTCP